MNTSNPANFGGLPYSGHMVADLKFESKTVSFSDINLNPVAAADVTEYCCLPVHPDSRSGILTRDSALNCILWFYGREKIIVFWAAESCTWLHLMFSARTKSGSAIYQQPQKKK